MAEAGAWAVKEAWSLSPAAIVQVEPARANVTAVVLAVPDVPSPERKHVDDVKSTREAEAAVGADVKAADGVTVIVLLPDAVSAEVAENVTV